jgi:hypothetical protein
VWFFSKIGVVTENFGWIEEKISTPERRDV